jgi:LPS sulfotransferase NodH
MATPSARQLVTTFHLGRSGSTVLGDLLDQHSAVAWLGEIQEWPEFREHPAPAGPGSELLRRLRSRLPGVTRPVVGVEAKFFHLHDHGIALHTFLDEMRSATPEGGACRFIVLRRKNYLRKIVSSLVARQRGRWFARQGTPLPPVHVEINPQRVCVDGDAQPLIDYLRDWDAQFDQLDAELAGDGALSLTYEDDIEQDPLVAYRKVCAHLGLPPETPEVRYTRTTAQPMAEIVTTLAAVRQALAGTDYAWMAD